jgi:Carboxylesterase family
VKRITKPGLISVVFCCVSFARSQSQSPTDSHLFATIDSGILEGAHFGTARNEVMFPGMGEPNAEDKRLVDLMTGYWTQFAKTGNPNGPGLPQWPPYDPKADLVFEIGHEVKLRSTPHVDRFAVFKRSLDTEVGPDTNPESDQ